MRSPRGRQCKLGPTLIFVGAKEIKKQEEKRKRKESR
jgi:hypothetical protein